MYVWQSPALNIDSSIWPERTLASTPGSPALGESATSVAGEAAWAQTHSGMITRLGDNAGADDNEFIFWNYRVGRAELRSSHSTELSRIAARWRKLFKDRSDLRVKIVGHASESGDAKKNEQLALRRAEFVRQFLVKRGIPASRIEVLSVGSEQPLADGTSPENLARNRRVELILFVPTRKVLSLGSTVRPVVHRFETCFPGATIGLEVDAKANLFSERVVGVIATAAIELSGPPGSAIGFLQFITKDSRLGLYKSQSGAKTVKLDQSRCTSPFLPCRDVEKASGSFSYVEFPGSTGPTTKPTQISFRDSPGNAFPIRITVPTIGGLTLSKTTWSTEFVLILGARLGEQFMPIRHIVWRIESERVFGSGALPTGIPKVSQVKAGPGAPGGLDIESAMASRTCRLLTRSIERSPKDPQVCRPPVV